MKASKYIISGRVQGVGFRWFTKKRADEIGVRGYVRNLADGKVEVLAVAEANQLAAFLAILKAGPSYSAVTAVQQSEVTIATDYSAFEITA